MLEHLIQTIAECQLNSEKLRLQVNPKTAFRLLTKDNEITGEDIRNFMDVTDGELEHILSFLDFDQDQHISYQDFAQATSSLEPTRQALLQLLRQEAINYNRLQILKQQLDPEILLSELDTENKGFITKRTLQNNCNLPLNTLNAFFRALDHKKDGKIYYGPLSIKYTELRKSQEKERQILHESRSLQQKLLIHDTEYQKMRLKQIQQCIQSRLNLERIKDPNSLHYQTLLKVRQQIQQIDYIRRNSQRDLFQRSLKHEQGILKDLNTLKIETAQKCKHLSSMHDQLYTMRTQQDVIHKRPRDMSLHSQSQLYI